MAQKNGFMMEKQNNYLLNINNPLDIPAVVYRLEKLVRETKKTTYILLDHQEEPTIVRGRLQPLSGNDIKRQDGGLSVYHVKGVSKCFMKAIYLENGQLIDEKRRASWGDELRVHFDEFGNFRTNQTKFEKSDIYNLDNSKQIAGTAYWKTKNVCIFRSCWYDREINLDLEKLIRKDTAHITDPEKVLNLIQVLNPEIFYNLSDKYKTIKMSAENFATEKNSTIEHYKKALELQNIKKGNLIGSCIGTEYGS